jgi:hypothetical protein
MGYRLGVHSYSFRVELVKSFMSPDDKTPSVPKKVRSFTIASEGSKPAAAQPTLVKNVYKSMAAIAAANGRKPYPLSAKYKKLLDRQARLIEILRDHGVSGPGASLTVNTSIASKLASKSSIQDVAKRVGIWTPSGKLSSSYKK